MKWEFKLLLFVIIIRLCYHMFSFLVPFYAAVETWGETVCFADTIKMHRILRTILVVIDHIFMHALSAGVILYVYRPYTGDRQSLLG